MKDKYLYLALFILCLCLGVLFAYRLYFNTHRINAVHNVLPVNEDKELKNPKEVRQYVLSVARAEGLNIDKVDKVISCESKYNINARNSTSTAKGLAQFLDGTWRNNCKGDVFNAQDNTKCFMDNFKKYPSWWEQCL